MQHVVARLQVLPGQVPVPYSARNSAAPAAQYYRTASASNGSDRGSSGGTQQAEVMMIDQRPTGSPQVAPAPAYASGQAPEPAQFTALGAHQRTWQSPAQGATNTASPVQLGGGSGTIGGSSGVGAGVAARVGQPAIGPWCTTYSTTFVQQEAYNSLMQQFREAAQQRQRSK